MTPGIAKKQRTGQRRPLPRSRETHIPISRCEGGEAAGMKDENKKRRFGWRGVLLCLFALIFLASTLTTLSVLISHRRADSAIQELRNQVRQSVTTGGLNTMSETTPAPKGQAEGPKDPAAPDEPVDEPKRQCSMDFSELKTINDDIIGWLYAEGTKIDYPVLHGEDNEYYLEHLYNGESNSAGSLFADYRNHGGFFDQNTVIYGHHMANGTMFGSIESYRDQDFYEAAPTMMLYTPDGDFLVELVCGTDESGYDEFVSFQFQSDEEFMKYVDALRARSTFQSDVKVQPGDKLISLCTCAYVFDNARYMLVGRLVELYESEDTAPAFPQGGQTDD